MLKMADEKKEAEDVKNQNNKDQSEEQTKHNINELKKFSELQRKACKTAAMKVFVVFLGFFIIALVITSTVLLTIMERFDNLGALSFNDGTGKLLIKNAGKDKALEGYIGKGIVGGKIYKRRITSRELFYEWDNKANLNIKKDSKFDKCFKIEWFPGSSGKTSLQDSFSLKGVHMYGGSELYVQSWPLELASIDVQPFLPHDTLLAYDNNKTIHGPVLDRYWINSNGVGVIVDESVPLHVGVNGKSSKSMLMLKSDLQGYGNSTLHLSYRICTGENIKQLYQNVMGSVLSLPKTIPDERMIKEPIWSTWAMYGKAVNQKDVTDFADQIKKFNFSCSQIEIDDMYSTAYGDFNFDTNKFPSATDMIDSLHNFGFRVTVWMYPFANTNSEEFLKAINSWVRGPDKDVPGLVKWWNGIGGVLDTTSSSSTQLFSDRLKAFQSKYKIDSFKFDAGSVSYLPKSFNLYNLTNNNPSCYSSNYAQLASEFGRLVEVRVGFRTQHLPIFVRMLDRASRWDRKNGLKSVIPTTLTFGILGYPFVLPDMVGGNGFQISASVNYTSKPDKELYIRWMQMNTFLPAIQFSFAPWLYDNQTVAIAKSLIDLRATISPSLIQAAKDVSIFNAPIIRPLWWISPNDENCLTIDTEFLVGDEYLVAPVLDPYSVNKGMHSVYLPAGRWKKEFGTKDIIDSTPDGKWMKFKVTLEDLPYFSVVKDV